MNLYTRKDIAAMAFAAGLLAGMFLAVSSCSPPEQVPYDQSECRNG